MKHRLSLSGGSFLPKVSKTCVNDPLRDVVLLHQPLNMSHWIVSKVLVLNLLTFIYVNLYIKIFVYSDDAHFERGQPRTLNIK